MQVKGVCRVGQKGFKKVKFEDGGSLVQGGVFGLSDRGMPVLQKLVVRGESGDSLVGLPQGTLLRIEGEQYQETFENDKKVKQYITVLDAWRVSVLTPSVEVSTDHSVHSNGNGVPAEVPF